MIRLIGALVVVGLMVKCAVGKKDVAQVDAARVESQQTAAAPQLTSTPPLPSKSPGNHAPPPKVKAKPVGTQAKN